MALKMKAVLLASAAAVTALMLTVAASGVLNSSQAVSPGGLATQIQTGISIVVYSDSASTQGAASVNWGNLHPGDSVTRTVYIKNTGLRTVHLSMQSNNYQPANVQNWMALTWDSEGRALAANEAVQVTLTLTVSQSIDAGITTFSLNIRFTGTA